MKFYLKMEVRPDWNAERNFLSKRGERNSAFCAGIFSSSWQIKYTRREHVYTYSQRDKGNTMSSGDKLAVLNKRANPFAAEIRVEEREDERKEKVKRRERLIARELHC